MKKFLISCGILFLSGCGTVFSGTNQTVSVNSNVPEAKVYVNGMPNCSTPCVIDLNRSNTNTTLILKKEGYEDFVFILKSQFNPTSLINLTMVYSWTTDFISGGVWRYAPDAVYVEMEKKKITVSEKLHSRKKAQIKRFVLFNFDALKSGSLEHLRALAELSGLNESKIKKIVVACENALIAAEKTASAV